MLATAACGGSKTYSTSSPTPASGGKSLFLSNCASCHNQDGSGGNKIGDVTSADLRWPMLGAMYNSDTSAVKRSILEGVDEKGEPLNAAMPRWKDKLTETQVDAIVQYMQTLK